jgi:4-hydroxybenzoate polyprenyltransferase
VTATRPHFFVFPAAAVLAGAASVLHGKPEAPGSGLLDAKMCLTVILVSAAWGVGQLANDVFDVKADAVEAPHRLLVRQPSSSCLVLKVASAAGLLIALSLYLLEPSSWPLLLASAVLMMSYTIFKRWPFTGNLAFAALLACAACLGAQVAGNDTWWRTELHGGTVRLVLVAVCGASYLQSNYEKDLAGDHAAGYRTAAWLLGLRASALLRLAVYAGFTVCAASVLSTWMGVVLLTLGAALCGLSALWVIAAPQQASARLSYRFAVHGAAFSILAIADLPQGVKLTSFEPASGVLISVFALFSLVLVERAFRHSDNP